MFLLIFYLQGARGLDAVLAGLLVAPVAVGLLTVSATSSYGGLCVWQFIIGLGSGIFSSPNTSAVMGAVPTSKRGVAAGTRMMLANLGMVMAIA